MNTRPVLDSGAGPYALSVSFNADCSCFSVALETGFRIFRSKSGDETTIREVGGGIGCAEMLGTTAYIALVGGGKQPKFPQNKVQIWNDQKELVTTSLEFKTPIQRVRISQKYLVVVLLNSVGIYEMKIPPVKLKDLETMNNPFGLCSLTDQFVAFPGKLAGQVKVFDFASKQVSIFNAHDSPLRALAMSRAGDLVATASEKGTIIRLWSYPSCAPLAEFRRGVDQAVVFSLAFSPSNSMLAVTSDKSTLHIFDLSAATTAETDPQRHKYGILSQIPLLPRQFSDKYPSASAKFEIGDEPIGWGPQAKSATLSAGIPGVPGGRPTKGLIGWLDEQTVLVVGAGQDARWEKFHVGFDPAGKRAIAWQGWRQYLNT